MTTWTGTTPKETMWGTDIIDEQSDVIYNSLFTYSQDYLTYNGDYIITETDWDSAIKTDTIWSS